MKPLFFCLVLLLQFTSIAFAQKASDKGIIQGQIVESGNEIAVPFAGLALYKDKQELTPLLTQQSDEKGQFKWTNLPAGTYRLKVSFVGYETRFVDAIVISHTQPLKSLGKIVLEVAPNALEEVVIQVEKPLVEFEADQITYNVGASLLAEGSTASDLLKNVPLVQVDLDGNASIAGKRNTRIFIDGKPSDYMSSSIGDLLNVLPSDAIEKIEVITSPPAKYSSDGEGIINIVLKKGVNLGFNGNLGATVGVLGNTNANANAAYKGKNFRLTGNAAYRKNIGRNQSENYRTNTFTDTTFYYNQFNQSRQLGSGGNFRSSLDWEISKSQNLKITSSYNENHNDNRSGNDFYYINEELEQVRLRRQQNTGDGANRNFVVTADYTLHIDTSGARMNAGLSVNRNTNHHFRAFDRQFTFPAHLHPSLQQNENDISNQGLNFTLDCDKPLFAKRDLLEVGLAFNYRRNNNDQQVRQFNFNEEVFLLNERLSNAFFFHERIFAAYASYRYRYKSLSFKAGLRSEITDVRFDLSNGENFNLTPYSNLFPSISVNHSFRKRYHLGLSYNVRINRPREQALNPQVNNTDTLNISYGNPHLRPAHTQQYDLSFSVFGQSWSFTPRLSYSNSSGVIERYRLVNADGISESTFGNLQSNRAIAFILIGNYKPTKQLSANANVSFIQSRYQASIYTGGLNRNGLSLRASTSLTFQLPYKTAFEAHVNYGSYINAQGRNKGSVVSSFAARKSFLKNKLAARLSATDPFGRRNQISVNQGLNFISEIYAYHQTSNLMISLNYRFSQIKNTKPKVSPSTAASNTKP